MRFSYGLREQPAWRILEARQGADAFDGIVGILLVLILLASIAAGKADARDEGVSLKGRVVISLGDVSSARLASYEGAFHGSPDIEVVRPYLKAVVFDGGLKTAGESPLGENLEFSFDGLVAGRRYYLILVVSRPYTVQEVIPLPTRWAFVYPAPGEKVHREWHSANGFIYNRIVERPGLSWHMTISFPHGGNWYQELTLRNQDEVFSSDPKPSSPLSSANPLWGTTGVDAVRNLLVESTEVSASAGSREVGVSVRVRNRGAEPALLVRALATFQDAAAGTVIGEYDGSVDAIKAGEVKTITVETALEAQALFSTRAEEFVVSLADPASQVDRRFKTRSVRVIVRLASP
jgi:hypothetical protein